MQCCSFRKPIGASSSMVGTCEGRRLSLSCNSRWTSCTLHVPLSHATLHARGQLWPCAAAAAVARPQLTGSLNIARPCFARSSQGNPYPVSGSDTPLQQDGGAGPASAADGFQQQQQQQQQQPAVSLAQANKVAGSPSLTAKLMKLADQQCIPLVLITMMSLGLAQPAWGVAAAQAGLTKAVTITIFIIAGLQLRRGEAFTALKAWGCVLFGLASILLLTPLAGPAVLALPVTDSMRPLLLGSAVFFCMPTTLSSGISMTTAAGGNTALAILLTVASNLLSVFTLPLLLPALLGPSVGAALQPATLLRQLCESVLLPIVLGATARAVVPGVAAWVDGNKRAVVWASACCLGLVPWMQVSKSAAAGLQVPLSALLLAAGIGAAFHILLLLFNWLAVAALGLGGQRPYEQAQLRQALVLQASQKTLPVAVAVLSEGQLAAQLGSLGAGLAAISAVAAHLTQVLVDSLLVGAFTNYIQQAAKQQALQDSQAPNPAT